MSTVQMSKIFPNKPLVTKHDGVIRNGVINLDFHYLELQYPSYFKHIRENQLKYLQETIANNNKCFREREIEQSYQKETTQNQETNTDAYAPEPLGDVCIYPEINIKMNFNNKYITEFFNNNPFIDIEEFILWSIKNYKNNK